MTQRLSLLLLALAVTLTSAACGGDKKTTLNGKDGEVDSDGGTLDGSTDANVQQDAAVAAAPTVRVLNATPTLPPLDAYVNDAFTVPVFEDVAFTTLSDAEEIPAGNYSFQFVSSDETEPSAGDVAVNLESQVFATDESYTVITLGDVSEFEAVRAYTELLPPDDGKARIRFINGSHSAGDISVFNSDDSDTLLAGDVAPYDDQTIQLAVAVATSIGVDVTDDNTPDVLFTVPALPSNLRANVVFLSDPSDDGAYKLIIQSLNTSTVTVITGQNVGG